MMIKGKMGDEESSAPDAQTMLEQGQQLCGIGESLITAAKAMGAVESEEVPATDDSEEEGAGEEEGEYDDSSDSALSPAKKAIVIAIRKRLGQ